MRVLELNETCFTNQLNFGDEIDVEALSDAFLHGVCQCNEICLSGATEVDDPVGVFIRDAHLALLKPFAAALVKKGSGGIGEGRAGGRVATSAGLLPVLGWYRCRGRRLGIFEETAAGVAGWLLTNT